MSGAELQDGVVDLPVVLGHHEAAQAVGGGLLVPRRRWLGRDHVTVEVSAAEPVEQDQPNPWPGVKRLHYKELTSRPVDQIVRGQDAISLF